MFTANTPGLHLAWLSEWIEHKLRLPEGVSAQPGPVRLWAYQREIANAISDRDRARHPSEAGPRRPYDGLD
jgi:hypothetical protein